MKNLESAVRESGGTSLQGYIEASYQDIVDSLGQPNSPVDEYKVDVGWAFKLGDTVFTIYNWKNGYNYCGDRDGVPVGSMNHWHVGGFSEEAVGAAISAVFGPDVEVIYFV
jgi:hypothetical protein